MTEQPGPRARAAASRTTLLFFIVAVAVYSLMTFGGIRETDGEVVFLTAESLALRGEFGVSDTIVGGGRFGLPKGTDGMRYSLFGPGQAVAAVPLVKLAHALNATRWYEAVPGWIPFSYYCTDRPETIIIEKKASDLAPHALRFVMCLFNILAGALCVAVFHRTARKLAPGEAGACYATIVFGFGSLFMTYTGTFFSEPLATLCVLLSLHALVANEVVGDASDPRLMERLLLSGLALGAAMLVHITAILFVPFFGVYALGPWFRMKAASPGRLFAAAALFGAGIAASSAAIAYFNFVRFGSVFETGRTADAAYIYGVFVAPWRALWALLFSSGKGLFLYAPAVLLSAAGWRHFHRRFRFLSFMIVSAAVFRWIFIATRTDWHGGVSMGPRYMVMLLPLLLLPLAAFFQAMIDQQRKDVLLASFLAVLACVGEQIYLALGEIYAFVHIVVWTAWQQDVNPLANDAIFLDWQYSPLLYLLAGPRGPHLLKAIPLGNGPLACVLIAVAAVILYAVHRRLTAAAVRPLHRSGPT